MYQFLNVHPEGKFVADCVKRAITTAAEMDYRDVQLELNRHKKLTGAKTFNEDKNWKSYVSNVLNGTWRSFPAKRGQPRMNGERFCRAYPKGRYILSMAGHLSCCIDGVIYDTWDCSSKTVYGVYEIFPDRLFERYYKVKKMNTSVIITLKESYDKEEVEYSIKLCDLNYYKKCLKTFGFNEKKT